MQPSSVTSSATPAADRAHPVVRRGHRVHGPDQVHAVPGAVRHVHPHLRLLQHRHGDLLGREPGMPHRHPAIRADGAGHGREGDGWARHAGPVPDGRELPVAPATAPAGTNFTAYVAPATTQVPRLQFAAQINGDVTVNSAKNNTLIFPIPAGATYVSAVATGGDYLTLPSANSLTPPQITFCPTKTSPGCVAQTSALLRHDGPVPAGDHTHHVVRRQPGDAADHRHHADRVRSGHHRPADRPLGVDRRHVHEPGSDELPGLPSDSSLALDAQGNPARSR